MSNATSQANAFAAQGVAAALAMPSMPTLPTLPTGKKWMDAAVGNYAGASAVGFAFGYQVNDNLNLGVGGVDGNKQRQRKPDCRPGAGGVCVVAGQQALALPQSQATRATRARMLEAEVLRATGTAHR